MIKIQQGTKKFNNEEKRSVLAESDNKEVAVTLAKYDIYPANYHRKWKLVLVRRMCIIALKCTT